MRRYQEFSESKSCKYCKRKFYNTNLNCGNPDFRKRKFCSHNCYAKSRIKKERTKPCPICNKRFVIKNTFPKQKYCSRECWKKSIIGKVAWNKGKRKYKKNCPYCKNKFATSSNDQIYCCQNCYSKSGRSRKGKSIFNNEEEKRIIKRTQGRKSYQKHISKRRFYYKQLSHKRRSAGGKHTLKQWQELKVEYNYTCPKCKRTEPEIKLTEDHIIPISKWKNWKESNPRIKYECNDIQNIQPLCKSCNAKKHSKIEK